MKKEESFVRTFKSLAESTRLKILRLLSAQKNLCVSSIAEELGITIALSSHHLKILEREGLVNRHREGKKVKYNLNKEGLDKFIINFYGYINIILEIENIPKLLGKELLGKVKRGFKTVGNDFKHAIQG